MNHHHFIRMTFSTEQIAEGYARGSCVTWTGALVSFDSNILGNLHEYAGFLKYLIELSSHPEFENYHMFVYGGLFPNWRKHLIHFSSGEAITSLEGVLAAYEEVKQVLLSLILHDLDSRNVPHEDDITIVIDRLIEVHYQHFAACSLFNVYAAVNYRTIRLWKFYKKEAAAWADEAKFVSIFV